MTRATCEVCTWTCEIDAETDRYDLNRAMIDHHVETGHAPIEATGVDETAATHRPADADDAVGAHRTTSPADPSEHGASAVVETDPSEAEPVDGTERPSEPVEEWTPVERPTVDRGPWRGGDDRR